jgi:hypothetical protein
MPIRPSRPGRGKPLPALPGNRDLTLPGFESGADLFMRSYVLETLARSGTHAPRGSLSRNLTALSEMVEEMSGWEAMAMTIQPN